MATVASPTAVTASQELIESVVEVTGSSQAEAEHLLAACANDVEAAVALFFEQGAPTNADVNDVLPTLPADLQQEEDEVRAPIAPIREQLIGPEDDNFYAAAPTLPGRMGTRATPRVKVCPFRDFAREGALMEDELQAAAATLESASSSGGVGATRSRRRARAAAMVSSAVDRKTRLDDLFRPPTDIAYAGTFQTARVRATELKHWLLVNVQSDSFDSQVLNRDVWADKEVRKLIRRQFMLWQVDADTSEGRRFVAFYHCTKLPYVCVIDPRTGEEIWKSVEPKQSNVLQNLQQYLRDHNDFSQEIADSNPTTSKRSNECITIDDDGDADADATQVSGSAKKRAKVVELSEEEQIALAIRNSIRENGVKETLSDDDDNDNENDEVEEEEASSDAPSTEEFVENDAKGICEKASYEMHLGQAKNEITMLKLRLINEKDLEEVVQLRWPSDTKVKVLRMYIRQHFPNIPKKGYKLICAFPRKTLEAEHDGSSLKDMSLHPSANLHVTLDD